SAFTPTSPPSFESASFASSARAHGSAAPGDIVLGGRGVLSTRYPPRRPTCLPLSPARPPAYPHRDAHDRISLTAAQPAAEDRAACSSRARGRLDERIGTAGADPAPQPRRRARGPRRHPARGSRG